MKLHSLIPVTVAAVLCLAPIGMHAQDVTASQPDVNSAIESLRADIHADKVAIINATMKFTPQQSAIFWPIYRKYSADLAKVDDERVALIREYAEKYDSLSDADARSLTARALTYQQKRLDVKKKYYKEFSSKLPGQTVARFFQLEHRLDLVVDLEMASRLPSLLEKQAGE